MKKSKISVKPMRRMTRKDLVVVREMWESDDPFEVEERLKDWMSDKSILTQVVTNDQDQIMGYVVFRLDPDYYDILELVVDSPFRRQGIGSAMLDQLRHQLRGTGRKYILFDTLDTELGSHLFLKFCGYKATTVFRHYDGDVYRFEIQRLPRPEPGSESLPVEDATASE